MGLYISHIDKKNFFKLLKMQLWSSQPFMYASAYTLTHNMHVSMH